MFIENPYQWGVSYDYALPLFRKHAFHIHSHGAIHTYKLMRMYVNALVQNEIPYQRQGRFLKRSRAFQER